MGLFDFFFFLSNKKNNDFIKENDINTAEVESNNSQDELDENEYSVILKDSGSNKIVVIKIVQKVTGLGLKEAKDLVDEAPQTLKKNISQKEADRIKKELTEAGAIVEIY